MVRVASLLVLLLPAAAAFAPAHRHAASVKKAPTALRMADIPSIPNDLQQKIKDFADRIDVSAITGSIKDNVMEGELGERGEVYTGVQAALILCILFGGVPVIGEPLMMLVGPGLAVAGVAAMLVSVNDLGDALSPWPVVPSQASLKTEGIYGELRHPMYAGLLCAMAGISILSGSADRLLLTAILMYALDVKSNYEEEELLKAFPEYAEYMEAVPSKFIPATLAKELPWNKE